MGHKSAKENIVVRFLRKKLFAPFLMKPFLQGSLQLRGLYLNRVAFVDDICGICFVFVKKNKQKLLLCFYDSPGAEQTTQVQVYQLPVAVGGLASLVLASLATGDIDYVRGIFSEEEKAAFRCNCSC